MTADLVPAGLAFLLLNDFLRRIAWGEKNRKNQLIVLAEMLGWFVFSVFAIESLGEYAFHWIFLMVGNLYMWDWVLGIPLRVNHASQKGVETCKIP